MSSDSRDGWAARRNGTCYSNESMLDSWGDFVKCCPSDKVIFVDKVTNLARCLDTKDTAQQVPQQCSNSSLTLWKDSLGYFCCDQDLTGFSNSVYYKGCASEAMIDKNNTWNRVTKFATISASGTLVTSGSSATPTSTATSGPSSTGGTPESSTSSHSTATSTGAIVGGTVGGFCGALIVVAAIWLFRRTRRRSTTKSSDNKFAMSESSYPQPDSQGFSRPRVHENTPSEVNGYPDPRELPSNTRPRYELLGDDHGRTALKSPSELD